ncbi:hypothetical protein ACIQ9P_28875 [Kitasatospora sp. NPDC094019]|uniref:hypothetical protein n=1 Tax=Kitasatospora sp. NPDC094019 TaxID=3364091 RepID=UPI00381C9531
MDPTAVELLTALAGGDGGEAGREAWAELGALVRRPFEAAPAVSSGEAQWVALGRAPNEVARAHELSTALAVRAALDAEFRADLVRWQEQARSVRTGQGTVNNSISGGTFHGSVAIVQGRDFHGALDFRRSE